MMMDVVNWDNFRIIFGVYFLFQLYRLASFVFRKPANLKGNFQVRKRPRGLRAVLPTPTISGFGVIHSARRTR
jgi:hypothetical protein